MCLAGNYVKTFAEASHALPDGMHMNADYPFMLPSIVKLVGRDVILRGRDGEGRFRITRGKDGREYCVIRQSSTFEAIYGRRPTAFRAYPFKDAGTPAILPPPLAREPL